MNVDMDMVVELIHEQVPLRELVKPVSKEVDNESTHDVQLLFRQRGRLQKSGPTSPYPTQSWTTNRHTEANILDFLADGASWRWGE